MVEEGRGGKLSTTRGPPEVPERVVGDMKKNGGFVNEKGDGFCEKRWGRWG